MIWGIYLMPSFKGQVQNNRCIINVWITGADAKPHSIPIDGKNTYKALIDTGAQSSCISQTVVAKLNFISYGKETIRSATDTKEVNQYRVTTHIPISKTTLSKGRITQAAQTRSVFSHTHSVIEIPNSDSGFDVILGMDVILHCDLFISHGEFVLAY